MRQLDLNTENTLSRRDHVTRDQPRAIHSIVIHEGSVGASQIAYFALRWIDLNHEVIARQGHVLRHWTMDEPRPPHNKGVVAFKVKRAALERAFQHHQSHMHQFVPSGLSRPDTT